jgi:hypothetical protein
LPLFLQNQLLDASQTLLDSSLHVRGLLHVLLRYQKAGSHLLSSISRRQINVKDIGFYTLATAIPVVLVGSTGIKLGLLGLVLLLYTLEAAVAGASLSLWHIATTMWFDHGQTVNQSGWAAAAAAAEGVAAGLDSGMSPAVLQESVKWGLRVFMMVIAGVFVVWRLHAQSAPQRHLAKMVEEVHAEVLRMQYEYAVRDAAGMPGVQGLGNGLNHNSLQTMGGQKVGGTQELQKLSRYLHPAAAGEGKVAGAAGAGVNSIVGLDHHYHHQQQQQQHHQHQQQHFLNQRGMGVMGGRFSVPNWLTEQLFHTERKGMMLPNHIGSSSKAGANFPLAATPTAAAVAASEAVADGGNGILTAYSIQNHPHHTKQQQPLLSQQQQQWQQLQHLDHARGSEVVISDDVSSGDDSDEGLAAAPAAATAVAAPKPRRTSSRRTSSGNSQDNAVATAAAAAGGGGGGGGGVTKGTVSSRRKRAAGAPAAGGGLTAVAEGEGEGEQKEPKAKKTKGKSS